MDHLKELNSHPSFLNIPNVNFQSLVAAVLELNERMSRADENNNKLAKEVSNLQEENRVLRLKLENNCRTTKVVQKQVQSLLVDQLELEIKIPEICDFVNSLATSVNQKIDHLNTQAKLCLINWQKSSEKNNVELSNLRDSINSLDKNSNRYWDWIKKEIDCINASGCLTEKHINELFEQCKPLTLHVDSLSDRVKKIEHVHSSLRNEPVGRLNRLAFKIDEVKRRLIMLAYTVANYNDSIPV